MSQAKMERRTHPCELEWQAPADGQTGSVVNVYTVHSQSDFSCLPVLVAYFGSFALIVFWCYQISVMLDGKFKPETSTVVALLAIPLVYWCWRHSARSLPHGIRLSADARGLNWERYSMGPVVEWRNLRPESLVLCQDQREVYIRVSNSGEEGYSSKDVPQSVYILKADEIELCYTQNVVLAMRTIRALARVMNMGFLDQTLAQPRQVSVQELQDSVQKHSTHFQLPDPPPTTRLHRSDSGIRLLSNAKIDPRLTPAIVPTFLVGACVVWYLTSGLWVGVGMMIWIGSSYLIASKLPRVQDSLELRQDGLYLIHHVSTGPKFEQLPVDLASRVEVAATSGQRSRAYCLRLQLGDVPFEVPVPLLQTEAEWLCQALTAP